MPWPIEISSTFAYKSANCLLTDIVSQKSLPPLSKCRVTPWRTCLKPLWKPPQPERDQDTEVSYSGCSPQHKGPFPSSSLDPNSLAIFCHSFWMHPVASQKLLWNGKRIGIRLLHPWAAVYTSCLLTSHQFPMAANTKCNSFSLDVEDDYINFKKPFLLLRCPLLT